MSLLTNTGRYASAGANLSDGVRFGVRDEVRAPDGEAGTPFAQGYRAAVGSGKKVRVHAARISMKSAAVILALCRKDASIRRILDQFTKYSYVDSEMDAQGRLLLPQALRNKMLGDAKEVDINGSYDHIIVQDSRRGIDEDTRFLEDFPDVYAVVSTAQQQL